MLTFSSENFSVTPGLAEARLHSVADMACLSSASPASKTSKNFASAGLWFPSMSGWALQHTPKETHFTLPSLGLCN